MSNADDQGSSQRPAILITGVSSGIGFDATRHLIKHGYFVFGSVRSAASQAEVEKAFPEHFQPLRFDVTDPQAIAAAVKVVQTQLGDTNLTALINNAGHAATGPLQLLDDDTFRQQLEVNLFGVRNVINAFLPQLGAKTGLAQYGHKPPPRSAMIINISSISGVVNTPINGAYCVAKHALESLGEVYRRELMPYGIDVVSIQPGPIQSRLWEKSKGTLSPFAESDYAPMVAKTEEIMHAAARDPLPAEVISRLIRRIIEQGGPRATYLIHRHPFFPRLLAGFLPARWADRLIWRKLCR